MRPHAPNDPGCVVRKDLSLIDHLGMMGSWECGEDCLFKGQYDNALKYFSDIGDGQYMYLAKVIVGALHEFALVPEVEHSVALGLYKEASEGDCPLGHLALLLAHHSGFPWLCLASKEEERLMTNLQNRNETDWEWLDRAAIEHRLPFAIYWYAWKANGFNEPVVTLLKEAAGGGVLPACVHLAKLIAADYDTHLGDADEGKRLLTQALEGGSSEALRFHAATTDDFELAKKMLLQACEKGNVNAMFDLFTMEDEEFPDVTTEVVHWINQAAQMGHRKAMERLGECFEFAKGGMTKDLPRALEHYVKSGELGYGAGYLMAAELLMEHGGSLGLNSGQITSQAKEYLEAAIASGCVTASFVLAVLFIEKKIEVPNGDQEAFRMLQSIAQEYLPALFLLGSCYEKGIGIQVNIEKAIEIFGEASRRGDKFSIQHLEKLIAEMGFLAPGQA